MKFPLRRVWLGLAMLLIGLRAGGGVVISEFMASNTRGLQDEDGEFSDWIELHNEGAVAVDLDNWFLTDDTKKPDQWRFPAVRLDPGARLLVFASGKDRKTAGSPLHTNFKLSTAGEALALVRPDRQTIEHGYLPTYPAQLNDVSYGLDTGLRPITLLSADAVGRIFAATQDLGGMEWTSPAFTDASWQRATSGVGFVIGELSQLDRPGLLSQLAGYWKFNETNGTNFADASGQGGDGKVIGLGATQSPWLPGLVDGSLRMRGAASRGLARVPNYPKATVALSGSAWVWADARLASATILRNGTPTNGQVQLGLRDTAGDLEVLIRTPGGAVSVREGVPLTTGQWHHVAFTADGTTLSLFRNGTLVGSSPYTGLLSTDVPEHLAIGARLNVAGTVADGSVPSQWTGRIDEVALWNRALSPAEVQVINDAGAGYGKSLRTSVQADLAGKPGSLLLRFPFTVADARSLVDWRLSLRYDDGVVVWLNGTEVARRNLPAETAWDSLSAEPRPQPDSLEPEVLNLAPFSDAFVTGANLLAVQVMRSSLSDNDLFLEPSIEVFSSEQTTNQPAYFLQSTPGAENRFGSAQLGPIITDLAHTPAVPREGEEVQVTARVTRTFGQIGPVTLFYRAMYSNEVSTLMADDGLHGDGAAGDGVFGSAIPPGTAKRGEMLRYRVVASDVDGRSQRLPRFADKLKTEEYLGTVVFNPGITSALPVMHWFLKNPAAADGDPGTQCSLFYDGEFYDNAYVRIRGGTSRSWPKTSKKVELPDDHEFRIRPGVGRVTEFDLNTTYTDKSYVRARMVYEEQRDIGMATPEIFHLRLEQNARFYSVTLFTEQPDAAFLRRNGLDDNGALYKGGPGANMETDTAFEKKTRKNEDNSDLRALIKGVTSSGATQENFVFDSIDLPAQVDYMATVAVTQNIDGSDKNYFIYRDTDGSGEWRMTPWDMDLSFGPNALNTDTMVYQEDFTSHPFLGASPYLLAGGKYNRLLDAVVASPRGRQMVLRRIRSLVDRHLATGFFESLIDTWEPQLAPDVLLDKARWKGDAFFGGNTYTLRQALDRIRTEYLTPRLDYLTRLTIPGIMAQNPMAQPYGVKVRFGQVVANPGTGDAEHEYLEVANQDTTPVDVSGWEIKGDVEFRFKPGTVIPTNTTLYLSPQVRKFRSRPVSPKGGQGLFVQGNYRGALSARGGSLRLLNEWGGEVDRISFAGSPSPAQNFLRITEIMFAPTPLTGDAYKPDEYEFLELRNVSPDVTLDLRGVRFSRGVDFQFTGSAVTSLSPGQRVVVVKNRAAFEARHGTGLLVAGTYLGSLENNGETVRLDDAFGEKIVEVGYDKDELPLTSGLGFSWVARDETAPWDAFADVSGWKSGAVFLGSPGIADPVLPPPAPVLITEVQSASPGGLDAIEIHNPSASPADIGGWYLSDDLKQPRKYRLPIGTTIAPGGYFAVSESAFGAGAAGFGLSSNGDEAWIFSASADGTLTGYFQGHRFGAVAAGVTLGRHVDSLGRVHFVPQSAPSLGTLNAGPLVGPLVISEVSAAPRAPAGVDARLLEFIELANISSQPLQLLAAGPGPSPWRIGGGVELNLPTELEIPPGGVLIAVAFDPSTDPVSLAAFRAAHATVPPAPIIGPWNGTLNNAGESVTLLRPLPVGGTNAVWMEVDRLDYSPDWAGAAGSAGPSLHRRLLSGFGNDPSNWVAAGPSPGVPWTIGQPPAWKQVPASLRAVAFSPVEFHAEAVDAAIPPSRPVRYQWMRDGVPIAGADQPTLRLQPAAPWDFGGYSVAAWNAFGSIVSSNAVLSLDLPPFVSQHPSPRTVKLGAAAAFSVTASGNGPLTYQWRRDGQPLPGANGPAYSIPVTRTGDAGIYDVVVTDSVGVMTSRGALLTVLVPPSITQAPDGVTVLVGETLRLLVSADGTQPLSFRWRRGTGSVVNQTNALLVLTNIQAPLAGSYSVVVANGAGSVTSRVAIVSVLADLDKDGMADDWETANGLNPAQAADALLDPDGDGAGNRAEYLAGTDPRDPLSVLRLTVEPMPPGGGGVVLSFLALSNRTYAIDGRRDPGSGEWLPTDTFPARPTNEVYSVPRPFGSNEAGLFRLRTPRLQ